MLASQPNRVPLKRLGAEIGEFAKLIAKVFLTFYVPILTVLVIFHFPYDTDVSATRELNRQRARRYYDAAYKASDERRRGIDYEESARKAAIDSDVEGVLRSFVSRYSLADKRVLEVGSGRGYLQDIVRDYTGLDLSASVAARYHKPFVNASATSIPFPDNSFDSIWSIWVLEHISEPEVALGEMRRVLKPGGLLFLAPTWNCDTWAADGFDVRPYSDFNWRGKLVKASIPVRTSPFFRVLYMLPIRGLRWIHYRLMGDGTRLRFRRLDPNYEIYWESDSDAAVSLDRYETYLWFKSRGDECLNWRPFDQTQLVLRIRK
jgi:SAM-dependent methyltransferase